jgi:hypothetical protein
VKKKWNIHPFIFDEILALFSNDIENGYYTPYFQLQNRFQTSSGFESSLIGNYFNKSYPIYTLSFIPTSVTFILNDQIDNSINQNLFVDGMRYMGKSMSLLLITILRGYINNSKYILIPKCTIPDMANSIYLSII